MGVRPEAASTKQATWTEVVDGTGAVRWDKPHLGSPVVQRITYIGCEGSSYEVVDALKRKEYRQQLGWTFSQGCSAKYFKAKSDV